jgi:hypothetical protein
MKPNLIKPANNFIEADMVKSNTRLEVDLGEFTPGMKEASLLQGPDESATGKFESEKGDLEFDYSGFCYDDAGEEEPTSQGIV